MHQRAAESTAPVTKSGVENGLLCFLPPYAWSLPVLLVSLPLAKALDLPPLFPLLSSAGFAMFSSYHPGRVEALGFALMRRRSDGLKLEYRGMDGKALGALK